MSHALAYEVPSIWNVLSHPQVTSLTLTVPKTQPKPHYLLGTFPSPLYIAQNHPFLYFCFMCCIKASPSLAAITQHAKSAASTFLFVSRPGSGRAETNLSISAPQTHTMLHVLSEKTTILDKAKHNKCYGRAKGSEVSDRKDTSCWTMRRRGRLSSALKRRQDFNWQRPRHGGW